MSRSKFPRVASRTRPRPSARRVKLPPLYVGIYVMGELVRVVEQRDPRELYVAEWNSRYLIEGEARPLDVDHDADAQRFLERKAVRHG